MCRFDSEPFWSIAVLSRYNCTVNYSNSSFHKTLQRITRAILWKKTQLSVPQMERNIEGIYRGSFILSHSLSSCIRTGKVLETPIKTSTRTPCTFMKSLLLIFPLLLKEKQVFLETSPSNSLQILNCKLDKPNMTKIWIFFGFIGAHLLYRNLYLYSGTMTKY